VPRPSPAPTILRGLLHPAWGPLVRVTLRHADGPAREGLALIDTGASMSAVDRQAARELALPSPGAATFFAVTATGDRHGQDPRYFKLDLIEVPDLHARVEGFHVVALLGWDFLGTCTLAFDGPAGTFTLGLPPPVRANRRRR
jgi:hypothetical protein